MDVHRERTVAEKFVKMSVGKWTAEGRVNNLLERIAFLKKAASPEG